MKTFNPIFISVRAFGKFFPLSAQHFSIDPSEIGERKEFILIQLPKAKIHIHGISKMMQSGDADLHQLELYRTVGGTREHLFTTIAVNITHPKPCVVLDAVRFGDREEFDLTQERDKDLQGRNYERALRFSSYFGHAAAKLGRKPEEMRHPTPEVLSIMRQLGQPLTGLFDHIENIPLPSGYPRKGDVEVTEIPRALNLHSLFDPEDVTDFAARIREATGAPLGSPEMRTKSVPKRPEPQQYKGDNVIPLTFGKRKPSLTPGGSGG